ncbi:deoxyribodipyrimidine photo-lyase [Bacteriovorax sp. DB6_IX]|uniref:cryptochrome/photolyase family protein n=1 Tax=Bacteriovorax sp. DB6_IX TaxID=1353530 RepID=UPI00038A18C7|nr:deoxyribodipyrimidine photo-lyase [Bacteriovorax sp. DB6_IX]EQC51241.1 putative deoxyribodipyrimidine photo-lyase [Bacteriovorax sp. DB6_IX]
MSEKEKLNIFWFRRDLRLEDNHGLLHALKADEKTIPIFIFDSNILDKIEDKSDKRVSFIYDNLSKLHEQLQELGSSLLVKYGKPVDIWKELIQDFDISCVYTNKDYEPYALERDRKIEQLLHKNQIEFRPYLDQCIFDVHDILKNDGKPYTVYTPYKRKWLERLGPKNLLSYNNKKFFSGFYQHKLNILKLEDIGFSYSNHGLKRKIPLKIIENYDQTRDYPYINGTSLLGAHLRFGTVSIRKCAQVAYNKNETWLSELIWREFFMQILYHFPHVQTQPFKEKYSKIKWKNNKKDFEKWKNGQTGFPLVDAGMRELNQTGHMHNRVRMLVASFLVKDLLIDWRWGEKYFASKLLDFDLSANNGNWQWAAGTGCDAAPYFRIFSPSNQIKKFDPDYKYIKKWVPEYGSEDYPEEMIDHNMAYHRAIKTYKEALS